MVIHLWRHLQPPCKALSCLRSRNWVEESSVFVAISFLYLSWSSPPQYPFNKKKWMPPPRPWAAPVSQLCTAINKSGRYNTTSPSPGRGSPGPGGRRRADRLAAQPNASGNQLHPSPAPPVHPAKVLRCRPWAESIPPTRKQLLLTRPCITGQCALLAADQTLGRAL